MAAREVWDKGVIKKIKSCPVADCKNLLGNDPLACILGGEGLQRVAGGGTGCRNSRATPGVGVNTNTLVNYQQCHYLPSEV